MSECHVLFFLRDHYVDHELSRHFNSEKSSLPPASTLAGPSVRLGEDTVKLKRYCVCP